MRSSRHWACEVNRALALTQYAQAAINSGVNDRPCRRHAKPISLDINIESWCSQPVRTRSGWHRTRPAAARSAQPHSHPHAGGPVAAIPQSKAKLYNPRLNACASLCNVTGRHSTWCCASFCALLRKPCKATAQGRKRWARQPRRFHPPIRRQPERASAFSCVRGRWGV